MCHKDVLLVYVNASLKCPIVCIIFIQLWWYEWEKNSSRWWQSLLESNIIAMAAYILSFFLVIKGLSHINLLVRKYICVQSFARTLRMTIIVSYNYFSTYFNIHEDLTNFWQFFWKKCQLLGNFLTVKWQFSEGQMKTNKRTYIQMFFFYNIESL